jgi:hypothetical protein
MTSEYDDQDGAPMSEEDHPSGLPLAIHKPQPMPVEQYQKAAAPVTAAQAKIEAVANLTMAAYEKAATLTITPEESAKLMADFPDDAFKSGAAGKENLIYIEHAYLRGRMNEVFGLGQWALIPRNRWAEPFIIPARTGKAAVEGQRVYVEAMLVVRGCFVGEAVGSMDYYPSNGQQDYSDAVEGAKTAAFRRCAKEFGIGLQAWRKDWCEGWWARKRSGGAQKPAYSPPGGSKPAPTAQHPPKPAETHQQPARAPETALEPAFPTKEGKEKMIGTLQAGPDGASRAFVTIYFQQIGQLMPNECIEDLPLRFCPATKGQMRLLCEKIGKFASDGVAERAFPPNPEAPAGKEPKKAKVEVPREETKPMELPDEWFMEIVCPIPRKGMTRDIYLQNPDTIGSLYVARHGDDDESQVARQRLWGFVNNYEPKGWTKRDGTVMPPSASDIKFREALDAFAEWFEKEHPEEKL